MLMDSHREWDWEGRENIIDRNNNKKIDVFFFVELFDYHLEKFSLQYDLSWLTDEKERAGGFASY